MSAPTSSAPYSPTFRAGRERSARPYLRRFALRPVLVDLSYASHMVFACPRTLRPAVMTATTPPRSPASRRSPPPLRAASRDEPVEAILFDMDGVLTLSEELSRE